MKGIKGQGGIHHIQSKRFWAREPDKPPALVDEEYLEKAYKLLSDDKYEKKVNAVMEIMQGKRIAGKQTLGDIVDRG